MPKINQNLRAKNHVCSNRIVRNSETKKISKKLFRTVKNYF